MGLQREFADDAYWMGLARQRGFRLPHQKTPVTPGGIRWWLRRLDLTMTEFLEHEGQSTIKAVRDAYSTWSMRALAGLMLEYTEQKETENGD